MALESGADRGAMEEGTSRQRTELFDALPAHQARVIARDQRQRTPAPPGEAKGEAQSELQYDPSGTHHPGVAGGDTKEGADRGLGRRYAVRRRGKRRRGDAGRSEKRPDLRMGSSFKAGRGDEECDC